MREHLMRDATLPALALGISACGPDPESPRMLRPGETPQIGVTYVVDPTATFDPDAEMAEPMDLNEFWNLVDDARSSGGRDRERVLAHLRASLRRMGEEAVRGYAVRFMSLHAAADREDLWDAAEMMCGGCGDDSFSQFRAWLISSGRESYEAALEDPDSLADALPDTVGSREFRWEEFEFAAEGVYMEMTGDSLWSTLPLDLELLVPAGGDESSVRGAARAERFPRLAAKYGVGDE